MMYENYVPTGELVIKQFERDQPDFLVMFKRMDSEYLLGFRNKIDAVKSIESTFALTEKQKGLTVELYGLCDTIIGKMEFLRTYVKPTGLNYSVITTINKQLRSRNVEGATKTGRDAMEYFKANEELFENGNMPDGFLTEISDLLDTMELKNTEQNSFFMNRSETIAQNRDVYNDLHRYISEVCEAGKLLYKKNSLKRKEYTMSYIKSLLRSAR